MKILACNFSGWGEAIPKGQKEKPKRGIKSLLFDPQIEWCAKNFCWVFSTSNLDKLKMSQIYQECYMNKLLPEQMLAEEYRSGPYGTCRYIADNFIRHLNSGIANDYRRDLYKYLFSDQLSKVALDIPIILHQDAVTRNPDKTYTIILKDLTFPNHQKVENKDIKFFLCKVDDGNAPAFYDIDNNRIVLGILDDHRNFTLRSLVKLYANRGILIHEIMHWCQRNLGIISDFNIADTGTAKYFKSKHEQQAYNIEIAERIINSIILSYRHDKKGFTKTVAEEDELKHIVDTEWDKICNLTNNSIEDNSLYMYLQALSEEEREKVHDFVTKYAVETLHRLYKPIDKQL